MGELSQGNEKVYISHEQFKVNDKNPKARRVHVSMKKGVHFSNIYFSYYPYTIFFSPTTFYFRHPLVAIFFSLSLSRPV